MLVQMVKYTVLYLIQRPSVYYTIIIVRQFLSPSPTLMAFAGVTNAHGPSPQPTASRSP